MNDELTETFPGGAKARWLRVVFMPMADGSAVQVKEIQAQGMPLQ